MSFQNSGSQPFANGSADMFARPTRGSFHSQGSSGQHQHSPDEGWPSNNFPNLQHLNSYNHGRRQDSQLLDIVNMEVYSMNQPGAEVAHYIDTRTAASSQFTVPGQTVTFRQPATLPSAPGFTLTNLPQDVLDTTPNGSLFSTAGNDATVHTSNSIVDAAPLSYPPGTNGAQSSSLFQPTFRGSSTEGDRAKTHNRTIDRLCDLLNRARERTQFYPLVVEAIATLTLKKYDEVLMSIAGLDDPSSTNLTVPSPEIHNREIDRVCDLLNQARERTKFYPVVAGILSYLTLRESHEVEVFRYSGSQPVSVVVPEDTSLDKLDLHVSQGARGYQGIGQGRPQLNQFTEIPTNPNSSTRGWDTSEMSNSVRSECLDIIKGGLQGRKSRITPEQREDNRRKPWNPARPYSCTYLCGTTSRRPHEFERHQHQHQSQYFLICDLPKVVHSPDGQRCSFCSKLNPDDQHFNQDHPKEIACREQKLRIGTKTGRIFRRREHFRNHFKNKHNRIPHESFESKFFFKIHGNFDPLCGFCGKRCSTWKMKNKHLEKHFLAGWTMDRWRDPWVPDALNSADSSPSRNNDRNDSEDDDDDDNDNDNDSPSDLEDDADNMTKAVKLDNNHRNQDTDSRSSATYSDRSYQMTFFNGKSSLFDGAKRGNFLWFIHFRGICGRLFTPADITAGQVTSTDVEVITRHLCRHADSPLMRSLKSISERGSESLVAIVFWINENSKFTFEALPLTCLKQNRVLRTGVSGVTYETNIRGQVFAQKTSFKNALNQFVNEIRMLDSIKHRHLITLKAVIFTSQDRSLLLSPVAEGSLLEFIQAPERLRLIKMDHFGCILSCLQYLHSKDVAHLDVKSSSILVCRSDSGDPTLMLVDFGNAQHLDMPTHVDFTRKCNTPEVISTQQPTAAADVYSIGMTIKEVLQAQHRTHANLPGPTKEQWCLIEEMISSPQETRPAVRDIIKVIPPASCCRAKVTPEQDRPNAESAQGEAFTISDTVQPTLGTVMSPSNTFADFLSESADRPSDHINRSIGVAPKQISGEFRHHSATSQPESHVEQHAQAAHPSNDALSSRSGDAVTDNEEHPTSASVLPASLSAHRSDGKPCRRLIVSIDFGTTFTSVSFIDCDVNENISDRELRTRIHTISNYPGDPRSLGDFSYVVPTKIWFRRSSDTVRSLETETDPGSTMEDVEMEDDDSIILSETEMGDFNLEKSNSAVLPIRKEDALWGFQIEEKVSKEQQLNVYGVRSLLEGSIDQVKLMLDDSEHTKEFRERLEKKIAAIKHKPFRKAERVIGQYLMHLLRHTKHQLQVWYDLDIANFDVLEMVLCVPPSWSAKARRIMTKATATAMKASNMMTTKKGSLTELFIYKEPEAAGCWILKAFDRATRIKPGDTVLFADLGGGTVDFSTYTIGRTDTLRLDREVVPPSGGTNGSVFLNHAFRKHVEARLDHAFGYLEQSTGRNREQILEGLLSRFEVNVKRTLDLTGRSSCRRIFEVPGLKPNAATGCTDGAFEVTGREFQQMFNPCIQEILNLIEHQIRECFKIGKEVDKVVLLGGFSDSPTVRHRVNRKIRKLSQELGVIRPIECISQLPQVSRLTAVSFGGVIRAIDKSHGPVRSLESSWGVLLSIPYDPDIHGNDPEVKIKHDKKDSTDYVENTVDYFATKGQIIPAQHKYIILAYHTFPTKPHTLRFLCDEVLCVADNSIESCWPITHSKNEGAEEFDRMAVDLTFLKTERLIEPEVNPLGKRYWYVAFKVIIEVEGLSLYWKAVWEGKNGETRDLSTRRQVMFAPGFFPGTA